MKSLNPKAVWLFFFDRNLVGAVIFYSVVISMISLFIIGDNGEFSTAGLVLMFFLIALFSVVTSFVLAKLTYRYYKYDIATDAFHSEKGIIYKKYISIPYERIQNVDIHRGILARFLGLSDIDIQTAGRSGTGFSNEGRLPGIDKEEAVHLRNKLISLAKSAKSSGV